MILMDVPPVLLGDLMRRRTQLEKQSERMAWVRRWLDPILFWFGWPTRWLLKRSRAWQAGIDAKAVQWVLDVEEFNSPGKPRISSDAQTSHWTVTRETRRILVAHGKTMHAKVFMDRQGNCQSWDEFLKVVQEFVTMSRLVRADNPPGLRIITGGGR